MRRFIIDFVAVLALGAVMTFTVAMASRPPAKPFRYDPPAVRYCLGVGAFQPCKRQEIDL